MNKGMSLLEILVVVSVFAILGIIVTQSVILTLRGSKKSESQVRVRENLNYALSVIERQLRNADSVTTCPNPDSSRIDYSDSLGNAASFSCIEAYVASGSARLTGSEIEVTACSFTCEAGVSVNPPAVTVSLEAKEASAIGIEGAQVSSSTKVYLRTY